MVELAKIRGCCDVTLRASVFGRKVCDRLDDLAAFVVERLAENWTPEQIAGWLKSGAEQFATVSHEAIYAWIYGRSQRQARLWRLLPRKKAKRGFRPARAPGTAKSTIGAT